MNLDYVKQQQQLFYFYFQFQAVPMQANKPLFIFFVIVYFVCKMQTNQMSAGNPSQTWRTAHVIKTADPDYNFYGA